MSRRSRVLSLLGPLVVAVLGLSSLAGIAGASAWKGGASSARPSLAPESRHVSPLTASLPITRAALLPLIANGPPPPLPPLPPPLPPPIPVVVTEPFDVESVRVTLESEQKVLRLAPIGFHVGPDDGDTDPELLQWMAALDAAGIPFVLKSVDNAEPIMQAQEMMALSGVPHVLIYRRSGTFWDVPRYDLPPEEAAVIHWERHRDAFPPELDPARVWLETVNEVDKHKAEWLGLFAIKTAELAIRDGFNWAAFGWSSGEPEPYHWRGPAMLDFLRLAAEHPGRIAIALHEYSLNATDIATLYPWRVGRFQLLFEVVDNARIPRPTVLITEWGWTHEVVPAPQPALEQIAWANWLYSAYPEVKGAAIWYLGPGFGGIAARAQLLIEPVREYTLHNYFVAEPGWGRINTTLFAPPEW